MPGSHPSKTQSCTQLPNGSYTKDLTVVEQDLGRICLVDNSPVCYTRNPSEYALSLCTGFVVNSIPCVAVNGIPIEGWTHDPSDEALLDLLPVLDSLRFTSDVRRVLGIRGFS
jgi:CTD nuclear envelope phosphatase 1